MSDTQDFVVNEILSYVQFYANRYPVDSLKTIIAECCSHDDILSAKRVLVDIADRKYQECLKDIKDNRRDTYQRLAVFANTQDIVSILKDLDEAQIDIPIFVARDFDKLPKATPDDACSMVSIAEKMNILEMKVCQLQESTVQQTDFLLAQQTQQDNANNTELPEQTYVKTVANTSNQSDDVSEIPDTEERVQQNSSHDDNDDFMLTREERRRIKRRDRMSWPFTDELSHDNTPDSNNKKQESNNIRIKDSNQRKTDDRRTEFKDPSDDDAKVILMCDSVARHVKPSLFFGPRYAKIVRSGWAATSTQVMERWKKNDSVEFVILHVGIRDVRDVDKPCDEILEDTKQCMKMAARQYKRARVIYSEILYTTDELHNDIIREINCAMKEFCETEEQYIFAQHSLIQQTDGMFVDETHLNEDRGTRTFVKDITKAALQGAKPNHSPRFRGAQRIDSDKGKSTEGYTSHSTQDMAQESSGGNLGNNAWRTARGTVSVDNHGNRNFEDSGAKDLIRLFVNILNRM